MTEKILFVDDDPNILAAYKRALRKEFNLESALGGEEGLKAVSANGPYAVIVADMRMPRMDGIQFLSKVKECSPDSVRMMLTGNADLQTAVDAVNEGNIFRFLTKPCPPKIFANALRAGIRQYQLVTAERELLQKTLRGSVKILTEILSLVNSAAFGRASRIRRYVRHIAGQLQLADVWQFELAAMLSQIGCVTLPSEVLDKIYAKRPLSDDEQTMFSAHPSVGAELLAKIPRLGLIARMIDGQQQPFKAHVPIGNLTGNERTVTLGSQILKVALDFDQLVVHGLSHKDALSKLRSREAEYNPRVVAVLEDLRLTKAGETVRTVRISDLRIHMVADEDIRARNGLLLVSKGQEVTHPVLARLRNFARGVGVVEPFRVKVVSENS